MDVYYLIKIIFFIAKIIIFLYLKVAGALFFAFNMGAYWEAYSIFKTPAFMIRPGVYRSESLFPPLICGVGEDTRISDLLYKTYKLRVFNFIYERASNSNFNLFKQVRVLDLIKYFFYYFSGLNRILILTIKTLLKFKLKKTRTKILYSLFIHFVDGRKLIRIDGIWVANGPKKELLQIFSSSKQVKTDFIFSVKNKLTLKEISERIYKLDNTPYQYALFINKKLPQIRHRIFLEVHNNNKLGLETDYIKSIKNNNYGKKFIISRYSAEKDSILLSYEPQDLKWVEGGKSVPIFNHVIGASLNGYNGDEISPKFKNSIILMNEILKDSEKFIRNNLLEVELKKFCENIHNYGCINEEDFY